MFFYTFSFTFCLNIFAFKKKGKKTILFVSSNLLSKFFFSESNYIQLYIDEAGKKRIFLLNIKQSMLIDNFTQTFLRYIFHVTIDIIELENFW